MAGISRMLDMLNATPNLNQIKQNISKRVFSNQFKVAKSQQPLKRKILNYKEGEIQVYDEHS